MNYVSRVMRYCDAMHDMAHLADRRALGSPMITLGNRSAV
jgi:hypothetical protein